ncbi:MAG TPA: hypothetical protein VGI40_18695 [Pirellulaceae bacterium]|jgi:hypothetical protein
MNATQFVASADNVSGAWLAPFERLLERGVEHIAPSIFGVEQFAQDGSVQEDHRVRTIVDEALSGFPKASSVQTTANVIFPISLWNKGTRNGAEALYQRFEAIWPRVKKCRGNWLGHYFHRMIAYQPAGSKEKPVNQLAHVIETVRQGNHRPTALQIAIFDPTRDHAHSRQRGFPCLQQVALCLDGGGITLTGFYGGQNIFDRGYGNLLGLCRLGQFLACELQLKLFRVSCIANVARLSTVGATKTALRSLQDRLSELKAAA